MAKQYHPSNNTNNGTSTNNGIKTQVYTQPVVTQTLAQKVDSELAQRIVDAKAKATAKKGARLNKAEIAKIVQHETDAQTKRVVREAKAKAVGTAIGTGAKNTAVVTGKLGKTLWNGSFGLIHGAITVAQNVPNIAVASVVVTAQAVKNEYDRA